MVIRRSSLREQVKQEILDRLAAGSLTPGTAVNEVHLAAELGVSRTPLREALFSLEQEGAISSIAGKGFFWTPVSVRELREITPMIAALESLAIELTSTDALAEIAPALIAEAKAFSTESAVHIELIKADDAWHSMLLSRCPNRRLLDVIGVQRGALRRYERLAVSDDTVVCRAASEHVAIAECLAGGDKAGAIAALKVNWMNGSERLIAQFEEEPEQVDNGRSERSVGRG